jgi:hypothetical protein
MTSPYHIKIIRKTWWNEDELIAVYVTIKQKNNTRLTADKIREHTAGPGVYDPRGTGP